MVIAVAAAPVPSARATAAGSNNLEFGCIDVLLEGDGAARDPSGDGVAACSAAMGTTFPPRPG
jgi:hypothetical protein